MDRAAEPGHALAAPSSAHTSRRAPPPCLLRAAPRGADRRMGTISQNGPTAKQGLRDDAADDHCTARTASANSRSDPRVIAVRDGVHRGEMFGVPEMAPWGGLAS